MDCGFSDLRMNPRSNEGTRIKKLAERFIVGSHDHSQRGRPARGPARGSLIAVDDSLCPGNTYSFATRREYANVSVDVSR